MNATPHALTLARPAIVVLIALNLAYALLIGLLFAASVIFPRFLFEALGGPEGNAAWELRNALRAVVVLGLLGAVVVHRVLRELLAIVDTVHAGDPFVERNAQRLQAIAWWVLAGEGLRIAIGTIVWWAARAAPSMRIDADVGFSFAPWLAVLLLFVLARVFAHGARMRADLEGTV